MNIIKLILTRIILLTNLHGLLHSRVPVLAKDTDLAIAKALHERVHSTGALLCSQYNKGVLCNTF